MFSYLLYISWVWLFSYVVFSAWSWICRTLTETSYNDAPFGSQIWYSSQFLEIYWFGLYDVANLHNNKFMSRLLLLFWVVLYSFISLKNFPGLTLFKDKEYAKIKLHFLSVTGIWQHHVPIKKHDSGTYLRMWKYVDALTKLLIQSQLSVAKHVDKTEINLLLVSS